MSDGGWRLPEEINPIDVIPICICVPDERNHVAAFWGALQELGYWFNWERDSEHRALPTSVRWNEIITAARSRVEAGNMCTSCEELIECLSPYLDEINANIDALRFPDGKKEPIEASKLTKNRGGGAGCNPDVVWAKSIQLVQWLNRLVTDALEAFEAATNSVEVAQAVTQVTLLDETSIDAVASFASAMQNFLAENYAAQYTLEYENELACAIFCACKDDCVFSVGRVYDVLLSRVNEHFGQSPALNLFGDLVGYVAGLPLSGTIVVDAAFLSIFGAMRLANWVIGSATRRPEIGLRALDLVLALAMNDASDDWMLLCDDCPSVRSYRATIDLRVGDGGALYLSSVAGHAGKWISGEGVAQGTRENQYNTWAAYPYWQWGDEVNLTRAEFVATRLLVSGAQGFTEHGYMNGSGATIFVGFDGTDNTFVDDIFVMPSPPLPVAAKGYQARVAANYASEQQIRILAVTIEFSATAVPAFFGANGWSVVEI